MKMLELDGKSNCNTAHSRINIKNSSKPYTWKQSKHRIHEVPWLLIKRLINNLCWQQNMALNFTHKDAVLNLRMASNFFLSTMPL